LNKFPTGGIGNDRSADAPIHVRYSDVRSRNHGTRFIPDMPEIDPAEAWLDASEAASVSRLQWLSDEH